MNDAPGFLDRRKQPAIQTAITKDTVKALVVSVLPWTPRINKVGINVLFVQPRRHSLRNELWTVVTFHIDWRTPLSK
jgi:hypothetical protein